MSWDFCADDGFTDQLAWVQNVVADHIQPLETLVDTLTPDQRTQAIGPLQDAVKARGLWAAHLPDDLGGTGMGQLPLAQMNLITGGVGLAMEVFGNMAPDSGNAELLAAGGTEQQKERWLWPISAARSGPHQSTGHVLGAPFFVMEYLDGVVIRRASLPSSYIAHPQAHCGVGEALVDTLVILHDVDWRNTPLDSIGHPEGFLERQVTPLDFAVGGLPNARPVRGW